MANSNFYTAKMTTEIDTTLTSSKQKTQKKIQKSFTNKAIKKTKKPIKEEDTTEDNSEKKTDTENKDTKDNSEEKTVDVSKIKTIDDFLKQTETKVKITKIGCEPWGLSDSTEDHNKLKVTITNKNGSISYIFWDSEYNTKEGKQSSVDDILASLAKDVEAFTSVTSFDEFKNTYGYSKAEEKRAKKAYDGCRKAMQKLNKMFDEEIKDKFLELSALSESDESQKITASYRKYENGYGVFDSKNIWLATFASEEAAKKFAENYPKLYKEYCDMARREIN